MSVGKYSPILPHVNKDFSFFKYNCYGKEPTPWTKELEEAGVVFDIKTMFGDYDSEGYDRYGYSCFDTDGEYVGLGQGIDRAGKSEDDYFEEYLAELREAELHEDNFDE